MLNVYSFQYIVKLNELFYNHKYGICSSLINESYYGTQTFYKVIWDVWPAIEQNAEMCVRLLVAN